MTARWPADARARLVRHAVRRAVTVALDAAVPPRTHRGRAPPPGEVAPDRDRVAISNGPPRRQRSAPPAIQHYLPRRMDPVEADGLSGPGLTCRALARALARWLAASASSASWAWRVS